MNQTLTVKNAFGIVLVSVLVAILAGSVPFFFSTTFLPEENTRTTSLLSLFFGQTFMIVPLLLFLHLKKEPLAERLRLHPVSTTVLSATTLLSVGIVIISDEIDRLTNLLLPQPDYFNQLENMLRFDSVLSVFFLLSTISILAPLGEELLFRGFLQKILEESWKDITKAVLITSVFFAFIHMNPYWIIQIYLMGILLGYLAWRTGSIIPGFILHGLNNTFALFLNNTTSSIEHIYSWNGHVTPLLLVIAVGLIIFGFKRLHTHLEILS